MAGPKLKVVLTRKLPSDSRDAHARAVRLLRWRAEWSTTTPLDVGELRSALGRADVLVPTITDRIDASLLEHAGPNLKLIANFGAGVDHIDVAAADGRGAWWSPTPRAC